MLFARLPAFDVAVVAVYFVGTILLGAWFARRQRDTNTYFVGGRNVSGWLVLISIVATETSTVTFLSVPGLAFTPADPERNIASGNLTFLQLALGYIIGRFFIAWLLLPQYVNGELLTAYQLLRQRFNSSVQRTASGIFLVTRTLADGMRLFLTALLLKQFTGWDITVSVLVMGFATIIYTYLGGMEAVIWTDVIQFAVYMIGALVAAAFILGQVQGGWNGFVAIGSDAGKFTLFDFKFDRTNEYTFWAGLIGGAFVTMATHGADQLMVQRYLCAKSLRSAQAALITSGVVVFAQFLVFLLIGVGLFVIWQQGVLNLPPELLQEMREKRSYDAVFGYYIVNYLPVGVVGLLVAAVLSAAMSTLSSSLNSSSSAVVNDFYRPLRPGRDERHYLRVSRAMTTVWGLAQMVVALFTAAVLKSNVIGMVLSIAGFTTGLVLGLFVLGSLRSPVRSSAALTGLVCGFLTVFVVWFPSSGLTAELPTWVPGWYRTKLLAWPWFAPIGAGTTVLVALVVNLFRPGKKETGTPVA
ncbi:MAG: sodium:solute symporter [Planctomycetia bacterium]|nr:sodium:solute symporter [Planctomycetia bacterium]